MLELTAQTRFTVPGRPVPKGRPRLGRGRTYTPPSTVAYEQAVGWCARSAHRGQPLPGPVAVRLELHLVATRRGDVDNYAKSLLDGMQGIVLLDDRQVRRLEVERHDAPGAGQERAEVLVVPYARPVSTTTRKAGPA